MKTDIHPKYVDAEIRCACGNVIKTRSTRPVIIVGICNVCHPFYTGQQKFVDTAGRVDKFQQRPPRRRPPRPRTPRRRRKRKLAFPEMPPAVLVAGIVGGFLLAMQPPKHLRFATCD